MWYDQSRGIPPVGSPLETVFLLVYLQRQESSLLATRAQAAAALGQDNAKSAQEAFKQYTEAMLPFLEKAKNTDQDKQRARLNQLLKHNIAIDLRAINQQKLEDARAKIKKRGLRR